MNEKMSPKNKALLINGCIIGTLIWSYYSGYPLLAIAISAMVLFTLANVLMYIKYRKRS
jgi:uncharacterized membrane protein